MDSRKMQCIMIGIILLMTSICTFAGQVCNEYIDRMMGDMKRDSDSFRDPYKISKKSVEISKQVLLFNFTGEASINDGNIFGTRTFFRDGDVVVNHNKTHFKIIIGAGEMLVKSSGEVKLMGHNSIVKVDARIHFVSMSLDVVPTSKDSNPNIQNFKFEDVQHLKYKVSDLGPLNFFMDTYMSIIGEFFRDIFIDVYENQMKRFLDKNVKKYPIPKGCLEDK